MAEELIGKLFMVLGAGMVAYVLYQDGRRKRK